MAPSLHQTRIESPLPARSPEADYEYLRGRIRETDQGIRELKELAKWARNAGVALTLSVVASLVSGGVYLGKVNRAVTDLAELRTEAVTAQRKISDLEMKVFVLQHQLKVEVKE
jgi:hypothetical protein